MTISVSLKTNCDRCDLPGGNVTCLVTVFGSGSMRLQYPEELTGYGLRAKKVWYEMGEEWHWSVLCSHCSDETDPATAKAPQQTGDTLADEVRSVIGELSVRRRDRMLSVYKTDGQLTEVLERAVLAIQELRGRAHVARRELARIEEALFDDGKYDNPRTLDVILDEIATLRANQRQA